MKLLDVPSGPDAAFRGLRRALARRRLREAGVSLAFLVVAIVAILSGFTFWRVRVPLDGLCRSHGAGTAVLLPAAVLVALALAAGFLAGERFAAMHARGPGPEWLALPAEPARIVAHLSGEARLPALFVLPLAAATLLAAVGLLPILVLLALAVAFALAWALATRTGVRLARDAGLPRRRRTGPRPGAAARAVTPDVAWLAAAARPRAPGRTSPATWDDGPPARALARLDRIATRRATASRARMLVAAGFAAAGLLLWSSDAEPRLRRLQAFAFFLPAAAMLGAWAIQRACAEPPDLHRPLPLSLGVVWRARAVPLLALLAALAVANALAAIGLPAPARLGIVATWVLPGLVVALLGLHYGLTLAPRADAAEAVYLSWLGVTIVASLMMPLLGWPVLAAGFVHASLRLRAGWRSELAA